MVDLQIITIKDILPVERVEPMQGFEPPSVIIYGREFLSTDEVLINDIPVPEFVVTSSTRILAQIPDSQKQGFLRSVTVLSRQPTPGKKSQLLFEIGRSGLQKITGIEKLVQQYVKILITTPGSDIFHPARGAGLKDLVGRIVSGSGSTSLTGSVVSAVSRARDQLITLQSQRPRIPPDERLLRADAQGVGYNSNTTTLSARISLGAVSGREAVANLTL